MISKKEFEYTVGRNLAKYRKEKKLTQMQVAEMAELSVPFYASVELGNRRNYSPAVQRNVQEACCLCRKCTQ